MHCFRRAMNCLLLIAPLSLASGAYGAPTPQQAGSEVKTVASGGLLNATQNGGFFVGGLEVHPMTGSVFVLAHNVSVWGFSSSIRFLEIPLGEDAELSGNPFTMTEQQSRGNDLVFKDGLFYFAGRRGVINGIYGFTPGSATITTYASGAGIPRWATSGLTFSEDGTMARVTSNALLGHYMVSQGSSNATQVVTEQALPTGLGGSASDHVITKDNRIIAAGESSRRLLDITMGAGNVTVFFDLTTIPGADFSGAPFGSRAAIDPVSGDIFVSYAVDSKQIFRVRADGSQGILFADGFTGTIRDIDFGPATDGSGRRNLFVSAIDAPSTGAVYEFTVPQEVGPTPATPCIPWHNGEPDFLHLIQSQDDAHGGSVRAADDFVFLEGESFYIQEVRLVMATSLLFGENPDVFLELYDDCNGKPGNVIQIYEDFDFIPLGFAPDGELQLYEFRFPINEAWAGGMYARRWLSPVGRGAGEYYWISSNNGVVQGVQGQIKAPGTCTGFDDEWSNGTESICFPFCSDFNFIITGDCCKPVIDNSNYELAGMASQQFMAHGPRAADDFQIPPGKCERELCSVEVWMAMNCDPALTKLEIYEQDCDMPTGDPIAVLEDPEVYPTGETILFQNRVLPVFHIVWRNPDVKLAPGRNYWISPYGFVSTGQSQHAVFLFADSEPCKLNINEGFFLHPSRGILDWTPTSLRAVGANPKDFAFRIWLRELDGTENSDDGSNEENGGIPLVVPQNKIDQMLYAIPDAR